MSYYRKSLEIIRPGVLRVSQESHNDLHVYFPCVPLAIKTIMIVLFKISTLFRFKAIRFSSLTLNEIMIALIAKGTQGSCAIAYFETRPCRRSDGLDITQSTLRVICGAKLEIK